jgi:hypothetical protein
MIDTSDMSTDNYALIRWRNKQNALLAEKMKKTLRDKYGTDYTKIRSKINSLEAENNRKAASIKKNKDAITNIRTLIENCQIYMDTFKTNDRFEKSTEQERYYQKLKAYCERHKTKVKMGFIWDCRNLISLKDSPFDKGKETFLQLYKNAVWI